ncbi:hypothetical protein GOBAR_AA32961 [Gossypium barbadense]|uniref:Uncharacterized protein n=1 Tax=Gossypium barbadense TaxID=3634 RepID=A0A2P5W9E9_GOSBA|nr:hypothetical protein GOBAR_AA32961 [Gossypium barbadense]
MPHRKFEHPRHGHWAFSLGKEPPDIEEKISATKQSLRYFWLAWSSLVLTLKAKNVNRMSKFTVLRDLNFVVENLGVEFFIAIVARGGVETLKPALQRLYMTRAYAYRDALKSFIEGYQEGIQQIMEKKEDSSKAQQEGNTDKNST